MFTLTKLSGVDIQPKARKGTKEERYRYLLQDVKAVLNDEDDLIACMSNVSAIIRQNFPEFSWTGFYIVRNGELVLGPFQGKVACYRIPKGKGVCGKAFAEKRGIVVRDVTRFDNHIVCDYYARAELTAPLLKGGEVKGILDLDSYIVGHFDKTDLKYMEEVAELISNKI